MSSPEIVVIDYAELVAASSIPNPSLHQKIEQAYGYEGLGILAIANVPGMEERRQALLPLAAQFAHLPAEVKQKTETPHAFYQVGWSYGNEKLQGDKPDLAKGSYYCNPLVDTPSLDPALIKRWPTFLEPNIWPTADLPGMEPAFKEMGQLVVSVGRLVARQCDHYVRAILGADYSPSTQLFDLLTTSQCCKGRLLHYFAQDEVARHTQATGEQKGQEKETPTDDTDFSDWCGWHNDHGSLTGLVPAIYMKEGKLVACPDPAAGLYIRGRQGQQVHIKIGETSQVHTGGVLQATPHAVRGPGGTESMGVTRETFAVFMQPEFDGAMTIPEGRTVEDVQVREAEHHLPKTVRPLRSRWQKGQTFGEFSDATFSAYY